MATPPSPARLFLSPLLQLTRLVSRRPDPGQLEREHPGVLEASTLALVFEERVMPRMRRGVDGEGEAANMESEGGPQHLISFESLMTWPDVQVQARVFTLVRSGP